MEDFFLGISFSDQFRGYIMMTTENSGLLIVDVQGTLANKVHNSSALLKNISILIQGAKLLSIPVIWVEQLPEKLGKTHPDISQYLPGHAFEKSSFSLWGEPKIRSEIETLNCRNWIVAGIECHVCVYQSVRDLLKMHYNVHVVGDGVSSRILGNKEIGLQAMQEAGAKITSTEMVLFELQQKGKGEGFRKLITLVK
jgi:nicotinamidase-related amidase